MLLMSAAIFTYGQTIYYWVGGTTPTTSVTIGTNWNTSLDGSGSSRPASTGTADILIVNGTNVGGATPATGTVAILVNGSFSCAQLKFVNNASATFSRATTGTSTVTIAGDVGDDVVIEAGSSLAFVSTSGSIRVTMGATNSARVDGTLIVNSLAAARFDNGTSGTGKFVFTAGSSFYNNAMPNASYAFGSNSQSTEKWTVFEDGSHIYYNGGTSPFGGVSTFSALDLKPGSTWHHRGNNPVSGSGSFFNRKSFGNIIVENNATLAAEGTIFRMNNLTVDAGATFTTHANGQTAVMGNITVNGVLNAPAAGSNELILAGNTPQTVSGTGSIDVAAFISGDKASVVLNKNMDVENAATVYGKMNFAGNQLTGPASFTAHGIDVPLPATANAVAGNYHLTGNVGLTTNTRGRSITGAGIPANTMVVAFSTTSDTIYISNAITATANAIAVSVTSSGASLETANTNGFDPATGSVVVAGTQTFDDNINYKINAATVTPFGVTTGSTASSINAGTVEIAAPVTVNKSINISQQLILNGKMSLRPLDVLHMLTTATIGGTFGGSSYVATGYNVTTGDQAILQYDGLSTNTTLPVGTANYYLPLQLNPASASNFTVSVFEGITVNGTVTGTAFTPLQKQTVVNAVWNVQRLTGTGTADVSINWDAALEGSTFTTLPGTDIGLIQNTGTTWSLPLATGDNVANTAAANVSSFGAFSAGAIQQVDPFVFNALPAKTYGDADFTGGATSLNTTQPIVYTSSNTAVATILNGFIHIVGAGTTDITASQATDGFYPPASVTRTLTVNKTALTIQADAKTKFETLPNPVLTATYTGFVLGETVTALLTPAVLTTTALQNSPAGKYLIEVSGATSGNYSISFINDSLTILPKQNQIITFNALAARNYGAPDFVLAATSTNNTIPIVYTSSNPAVATVTGNLVHIVSAGTTNITASQAGSDGYFAAASVVRALVVNKVPLTIRVRDTVKIEGQVNPDFTITYTGFVLGETVANLTTPATITTIAGTNSAPGYYALVPGGAASSNYNFTYTAGRLTILPASDTTQQYITAFLLNSNQLNVRVYSPKPALGDIYLYDLSGRLILKKNLFMPKGFINNTLDVTRVANGFYVVAIKGDGVNLVKTISITR